MGAIHAFEEAMYANRLFVTARLRAKTGMEKMVASELAALIAPTRRELGCYMYEIHQSQDTPTLFVLHEQWRSKDDFDAHFKMPYLERFVHAAESLLDGPMEIVFLNRLEPEAD